MNETIQERDDFSLRRFFNLIKRSAKRLLIYGVIAAVVGLCLAALIAVVTMGDVEYRGAVEFTHGSAIDGLDPFGSPLDYNRIKSASVIGMALRSMGYSEDEVSELSEKLEGSIYIVPYVSDAVNKLLQADPSYSYYPTRYTVRVLPSSSLDMDDARILSFVNELMNAYIEYFKSYYNYSITTVSVGESDLSSGDYYDLVVGYYNELEAMRASVNALPENFAGVANSLLARINVLNGYLNDVENYILTKNVRKEGATELTVNITSRITEYRALATLYETVSASLDEPIAQYRQMFNSIVVGETITLTSADATAYNALVAEKKDAVKLYAQYLSGAERLESKLTLVGGGECTEEDIAYVEAKLAALKDSFEAEGENINAHLALYADSAVLNGGVKVVVAAYKVREVEYAGAAVAFVIVLLVGLFAAVAVTAVKGKRNPDKAEKKTSGA